MNTSANEKLHLFYNRYKCFTMKNFTKFAMILYVVFGFVMSIIYVHYIIYRYKILTIFNQILFYIYIIVMSKYN